jgi:hypothetical protein
MQYEQFFVASRTSLGSRFYPQRNGNANPARITYAILRKVEEEPGSRSTLPPAGLLESAAGDLRFAFPGVKQCKNCIVVVVAFTTFYNRLRCLDTILMAGLYSLALILVSGPPGED